MSAPVVFLTLAQQAQQRLALVACLDGTLLALVAEHGEASGSPAYTAGPSSSSAAGLQLSLLSHWSHKFAAPLFAPPAVVEVPAPAAATAVGAGAPQPLQLVVAAAVDGSVTALDAASGCPQWSCQLGGPVFTAPVVLEGPVRSGCGSSSGSGSSGSNGSSLVPEVGAAAGAALQTLLWGTQTGGLCVLAAASGAMVARLGLGAKVTGLCRLGAPPLATAAGREWLAVSTQPGTVCLLDYGPLLRAAVAAAAAEAADAAPAAPEGPSLIEACLLDAVQLPGEVFSAPTAWAAGRGLTVVVGCRDDHVYALHAALDGPV